MNIGEDEWEDELFDGTVACVFTTAEKKLAERNINNNNNNNNRKGALSSHSCGAFLKEIYVSAATNVSREYCSVGAADAAGRARYYSMR